LEFVAESPSDNDDIARVFFELARISAAEGKNVDAVELLEQTRTVLNNAPVPDDKLLNKINSLSLKLSSTPNTPAKK